MNIFHSDLLRYLANILTVTRMAGAAGLLFLRVFSAPFYVCYVFCGVSDMLDGFVARKTHSESETGARLDSIADLIFIAVCFVKMLPVIDIPVFLWIWIGVIALIKIATVVTGIIRRRARGRNRGRGLNKERGGIFLHTFANKATGFLLFLLPLTLTVIPVAYSATIVCALASFAAVQEAFLAARR